MARLPLTVIGGFLGAGKTTLLNRVLAEAAGRRIAVLVNDFGALNIDAALVAGNDGRTLALSNGCVCCSIGDELSDALISVLDATPPFDAVVIEASGVSDPWRIAEVGLADPGLSLNGVWVLIDAAALEDHAADPLLADSLVRQVKAADFILVNKCDLIDAGQRQRVRAWVTRQAPGTPLFETVDAALPLEVVLGTVGDAPVVARAAGHAHGHAHDHDHAAFESWSLRPPGPLAAAALRDLLGAMLPGVLRLKGVVATDRHGWSEIQFAGRRGSLRKATPAAAAVADTRGSGVVAIGLHGRLPVAALDAAFARCGGVALPSEPIH